MGAVLAEQAESKSEQFDKLRDGLLLVNSSTFVHGIDGPVGDPVDCALTRWGSSILGGADAVTVLRESQPELFLYPYNSQRKIAISIRKTPQGPRLLAKGAASSILNLCSLQINDNGEHVPVDEDAILGLEKGAHRQLTSKGLTVVALAEFLLDPQQFPDDFVYELGADGPNFPMKGWTWVGMVGLRDPVRPTAAPTIAQAFDLGLRIVFCTPEHEDTTSEIIRQVLGPQKEMKVVSGLEMELSEEELENLVADSLLPDAPVFVWTRMNSRQKVQEMATRRHLQLILFARFDW